ncbi:MAG: sugar ABC transporter permease [Lachnospiraceae bacterium]|nr:sugar ABC transporter permease [Lachnospiraceae bacterium]
MKKRKLTPYFFVLPGLIIILLFVYYPIIQNLIYSVLDWDLFSGTKKFIGLKNYIKLFKNDSFRVALKNNLWYIGISLFFQVGVSLIIAAILENMKMKKLSALYRTTFFIPSLISLTVIGLLFTFVFEPQGILNSFLRSVGLESLARGWLGDEKTAIFAVIAVSQWKSIGYTMVLLIVAIQRIPVEITEAATLDGASKLQTFLHVTVPMIKDTILTVMIITTSGGFLVFNEVYIITNGGPYGSSEVLSTILYKNAFVHGKIGYASSIGNIILVFSVLFALIQNGAFSGIGKKKRGETGV